MKLSFHGTVLPSGVLALDNRDGFLKASLALVGKRITVTLGRFRKPRSTNQNAYMWAVVYQAIALETGSEPEEVHEAMGVRFRLVHGGKLGVKVRSTTDLSTVEMEDYLAKVRAYAATELGILIPLPNEAVIPDHYQEAA